MIPFVFLARCYSYKHKLYKQIVAAKEDDGGGVGGSGTVSYYALTTSAGEERWRHDHNDPKSSSSSSSPASDETETKTGYERLSSRLLERGGCQLEHGSFRTHQIEARDEIVPDTKG